MDRRDTEDAGGTIAVLGGGVVGITTAIHLELVGYDTTIFAARLPGDDDPGPTFASHYAAASVKPSFVTMRNLRRVLEHSQDVFGLLWEAGSMGVRRQPSFELFEEDCPDPEYAGVLHGFDRIENVEAYPRRTGAAEVFGWRFSVYFAETPAFLDRCYALYCALGGEVRRREITREEIGSLPGDVLVNCTGFWSRDLFDEPRPYEAHVGHQVLARGVPPVRDPAGRLFSYSYVTDDRAPPDQSGLVYSYPRMDALVLGGSRIPADVAPGEPWNGEIDGPTRTIDGIDVPARIVETNADLLRGYAGVDLDDAVLTARYGYRPVRDPDGEGVRIEREAVDGRPVVHNYGHGGAGVTLSWGSAAEVGSLVREVVEPDPGPVDVPVEYAVAERLAKLVRS